MLIYEIPYYSDKYPNSLSDSLELIVSTNEKLDGICLFSISRYIDVKSKKYFVPKSLYLIFAEKYLEYFSQLLSTYEAKRLNSVLSFDCASILSGNGNLI